MLSTTSVVVMFIYYFFRLLKIFSELGNLSLISKTVNDGGKQALLLRKRREKVIIVQIYRFEKGTFRWHHKVELSELFLP